MPLVLPPEHYYFRFLTALLTNLTAFLFMSLLATFTGCLLSLLSILVLTLCWHSAPGLVQYGLTWDIILDMFLSQSDGLDIEPLIDSFFII